MKNNYFSFGSLLIANFLYGFYAVIVRTIGFNLPLFYQSWTRNLIICLILIIPIVIWKKWQTVEKKDVKWIILRSVGGFFGFFGSFIAFVFLPIGTAYFIFFGSSAISGFLLGKILFREKLTVFKIASLILSLIGLILIYSFNFESGKLFYILCAFISGIGTAVWNIFSKKVSDSYFTIQLNFIDSFLFIIYCFTLSLIYKEQWVMPVFSLPWLANLIFAIMFLATGQLIIYGFRHLDAQIGSLVMLMEVVFGIILGFLIYKETLSFITLLGGLLIIAASVLPVVKFFKPPNSHNQKKINNRRDAERTKHL